MEFYGLLPIGSVVLLKESEKKIMIVGVCQRKADGSEKVYDYVAVFYPEGLLDPNNMFLFDGDDIAEVFMLGFQDAEQLHFKQDVDKWLEEYRKNENK